MAWKLMRNYAFLAKALYAVQYLISRPGRFNSGETACGTRLIDGWVSSRVFLDAATTRNWKPDSAVG